MQTRCSDENSVCVSVRHTRGLWQNGRKICPDLYTIRKNIYPSFLKRTMVGGGRPLLPEILGQPTPIGTKSPICVTAEARSASAVTPSEKSSINANRKSTTRFPMSLRWSSYVAPKSPKGASKRQSGRFLLKNALRLKKVCYKVCVKTVSGKVVRHSLA